MIFGLRCRLFPEFSGEKPATVLTSDLTRTISRMLPGWYRYWPSKSENNYYPNGFDARRIPQINLASAELCDDGGDFSRTGDNHTSS